MKDLEIGIVKMQYGEDGDVKSASFEPKIQVSVGGELLARLHSVNSPTNSDIIKSNADMVLASFFSKINEIELADREEYEVTSEVINCEKYPNDTVKTCEIKYLFKKIKTEVGMDEDFKRPRVQVTEQDGNIFSILGKCKKALNGVAPSEKIDEMSKRVVHAVDYDDAIGIMEEYCELM